MTEQEKSYILEHLANVHLFKVFPPDELDQLLPYFEMRSFAENAVLFEEGDMGEYVCVVIDGNVEIRKEYLTGNQSVITRFGRGSTVGEMAIIDHSPRSATARVTAGTKLLLLYRERFDDLIESYPKLGVQFIKGIARILSLRLRRTTRRFTDAL